MGLSWIIWTQLTIWQEEEGVDSAEYRWQSFQYEDLLQRQLALLGRWITAYVQFVPISTQPIRRHRS